MLSDYLIYYKRLLKLAFPLVLTQAGQMVVQLVDNAMVGRVGTTELAAASFANSIFVVIMVFGLGIFLGVTPLIGHALGAKNDKRVASIMKNSLVLSLFLVTILTLLTWSLSWFMHLMGQPELVWKMAIPYFRILAISLLPFLLFMVLKQIGEGLNNTWWAMIATILSNVLNVALNYVLIFGKMGFPELGLIGAGYATLISRVTMPILLFVGFMLSKKMRHYFTLVPVVKSSIKEIKRILDVGFPISIQLVIEVSLFALGAVMMGWIGDVPLAAHQIALGLASFTFMIANGVAMATTIRVSFQLGLKAYNSMEKVTLSAIHLVLLYMLLCGIGFLVFRNQLPKIFTLDPLVISQAASLIVVAALFQLFDGLQVVCLGVLRGFADVKIPMIIAAISYLGIGIPVSYLFAFKFNFGPEGIWYGFVAGLATAGILLSFRIRKKIKEVEKK
ncbi:MAG: MATE family efflux transporter [Prolixibacteraceae bacterium]|jgi:MATE family multidrug resistance protein|nr:MATE family efflux transporter [Prolixibacteraceae bacterium]